MVVVGSREGCDAGCWFIVMVVAIVVVREVLVVEEMLNWQLS